VSVLLTGKASVWVDVVVANVLTTVVGAGGNRAAVLADADDGTYHFASAAQEVNVWPMVWRVQMQAYEGLPAWDDNNAEAFRIEWVRPRARMRMDGAYAQTWGIWLYRYIGGAEDTYLWSHDASVVADGAFHDWFASPIARDPSTGFDWARDRVNVFAMASQSYDALALHGQSSVSGDTYLSQLWLDLSYVRRGSVVATGPGPSVTTLTPTVTWHPSAPDNPSNPQVGYMVRVFAEEVYRAGGFSPWSPVGAVWDSGYVPGVWTRAARLPVRLEGGKTYRAYVFSAQPWGGTNRNPWWSQPRSPST
jgi:hypothetical protein